jgi:hypothetical protein
VKYYNLFKNIQIVKPRLDEKENIELVSRKKDVLFKIILYAQ